MKVVYLRQVYQSHEEPAWSTVTASPARPFGAIDTSVQDLVILCAIVCGNSIVNIHNGEVF